VQKPTFGGMQVYASCVQGVPNAELRERLVGVAAEISTAYDFYEDRAMVGQLYEVTRSGGSDDELVTSRVTKGELRELYSSQMVRSGSPARDVYDVLRGSAPYGKCPTCGFGHVYNLDHFLPKAKYPWFSVMPENLVPSCRDCNFGKQAHSSETTQSFHPYYDHAQLMGEQWIYAEVAQTIPITVAYRVQTPAHWAAELQARAQNHFQEYKLAERYAKEAATEMASLRGILSTAPPLNTAQIIDYLERTLAGERTLQTNSWRIALYQALLAAYWFAEGPVF